MKNVNISNLVFHLEIIEIIVSSMNGKPHFGNSLKFKKSSMMVVYIFGTFRTVCFFHLKEYFKSSYDITRYIIFPNSTTCFALSMILVTPTHGLTYSTFMTIRASDIDSYGKTQEHGLTGRFFLSVTGQ